MLMLAMQKTGAMAIQNQKPLLGLKSVRAMPTTDNNNKRIRTNSEVCRFFGVLLDPLGMFPDMGFSFLRAR
jgi:hypothetical protein